MKKSCGIILYRNINNIIEILLCHCGGPYYKDNYLKGWSLSKGELDKNENIIDCAKREFYEETNLKLKDNINYLCSYKVSRKKLVIMFYHEEDIDISKCKSNTFKLESPKNSGIYKEYPEMDKYEWFTLDNAKKLIFPNQIKFIIRLEQILNEQ